MRMQYAFPRVQVLPDWERVNFQVDGVERFSYRYPRESQRPFLFPVSGVSGVGLTRMGHPNPVGHEHHKSVWFGHQKVNGLNFWEERGGTDVRVRHQRVVLIHEGPEWSGLVADLEWWGSGRAHLNQRLTLVLEPLGERDYAIDLQSRFEAPNGPVDLGQTNFGFLGVRVAKSLSEQFGGGRLLNDQGATGERAIFGKPSRWVDYSGPSRPDQQEGICYLDHPSNPNHPTSWHVRQDGWMEAAFNLRGPHGVARDHPLDLRYRLLVHHGHLSVADGTKAWERFAATPPYQILPATGGGLTGLRRQPAD